MAGGFSKIVRRDDFSTSPRNQAGQGLEVDAGFQEVYRAVGEQGIGAAGMEAIDFRRIGAVDGTWPGAGIVGRRRTPDQDLAPAPLDPGAAARRTRYDGISEPKPTTIPRPGSTDLFTAAP